MGLLVVSREQDEEVVDEATSSWLGIQRLVVEEKNNLPWILKVMGPKVMTLAATMVWASS